MLPIELVQGNKLSNFTIMSHYYSKVGADILLSLVSASDCVDYFDVASLVSEMD